ncbi:MAG: hypothetical protein KDJ54_05525 [Candidatus Competibacteraceae bacterium]|nr:hypothetical protein [Candidatus Competibacteraceae bacterium]
MIELAVELRNPGEVLAACGLFNLAARRGWATARFASDGRFCLDTPMTLEALLTGLNVEELTIADDLSWVDLAGVRLNWWMREGDDFKLWAGQVNPDNLIRGLLDACDRVRGSALKGKLLSAAIPMTKRFGADPRSSWISLDIGYSPNDQGTGAIHTRPFAELLAMIGLQTFLPRKRESRAFVYRVWYSMLPLLPARLAFAGVAMPVPDGRYHFTVNKSGSFSVFDFAELEE